MFNEEDYKSIFTRNLNYFMELNQKTQIDIINDLGFNKSAVSTWCNGTRLPRMDKVEILSRYFNIENSDLLEDKSAKKDQGYYLNDETRQIAQDIFDNKDLRILFDASRKAKPDDLKFIIEMAKRFRGEDD